MHVIISMVFLVLLLACSTKYKGLHSDLHRFNKDIDYCIKKSCKNQYKSVFINFTLISPLLAYGGGGGGGGSSSIPENKISFKTFKLCLKEKGYIKDENGMFALPYITCKKN